MKKNNSNKPLVSVLMGVYNEEKWVNKSIESIIGQTYVNLEFIIINDGSTDSTKDILLEYAKKDSRIKVIDQKNLGLTKSLNRGLDNCKGKYIARIDADNIALKNRIKEQVDFLEENLDYALIGSLREDIFPDGQKVVMRLPILDKDVRKGLMKACIISHSSVMARTSVMKKLKYNEKFRTSQDYELWTRMGAKYKLGNIDKVLSRAYYRENSITRTKSRIKRLYFHTLIKIKVFFNLKLPFYYIVYIIKPFVEFLVPQKMLKMYVINKTKL